MDFTKSFPFLKSFFSFFFLSVTVKHSTHITHIRTEENPDGRRTRRIFIIVPIQRYSKYPRSSRNARLLDVVPRLYIMVLYTKRVKLTRIRVYYRGPFRKLLFTIFTLDPAERDIGRREKFSHAYLYGTPIRNIGTGYIICTTV